MSRPSQYARTLGRTAQSSNLTASRTPIRSVANPQNSSRGVETLSPITISRPRRPSSYASSSHAQSRSPALVSSKRSASSSTSDAASSSDAFAGLEPVDLAYDLIQPTKAKPEAEGQCLVVTHGLFGSKQNWRSLAKAFSIQLGMPVYTIDLRNHGTSPHAEPHTYAAMATDLDYLFRKLDLKGINLMGHSMGGKAVMAFALNSNFNRELRSLISVDMSPAVGRISPEFAAYTQGMRKVDQARVKSKAEADKILQEVEPVLSTRQFLLTNTRTLPSGDLSFRIPLDLLDRSIPHIGDFPYPQPDQPGSPSWPGPTLFLKGEHSKYLNRRNIPIAEAYFPAMRLEVLPTGHWVHAEEPGQTLKLVKKFVEGVGK